MKKQKCDNCGEYKVVTNRAYYLMVAGAIFLLGSIFLLLVIGIFMWFAAIGLAIFAFKADGRRCLNCKKVYEN